ncbi:unnamed protein product [Ascophyllum nodosum]
MASLSRLFIVVAISVALVLALAVGLLGSGVGGNGCWQRSFSPSGGAWIGDNGNALRDGGKSGAVRDQDFRTTSRGLGGKDDGEKRARVAYLVMSGGDDIEKLHLLLPAIYHPDNIYLVHVDAKTSPKKVEQIRRAVAFYFPAREGRPPNGRLLEPAIIVSWGGFSITLTCLYAIAASLQWDKSWDYFINLSTSDFPVMTQDEIQLLLGEYAENRTNFIDGELMKGFEARWQGYIEDQGLQRKSGTHTTEAMTLLRGIERPHPQLFDLYKGEFWFALHRSFCEYASWSPDNVARTLAAYFTGYRVSDESYFQTLACHPEGVEFPIVGDNLRFTSWNEDHRDERGRKVDARGNILIHPEPLNMASLEKIKASGALFARKFDYVTSYEVYKALLDDLQHHDGGDHESVPPARLERARARVGVRSRNTKGRRGFCEPYRAQKGSRHRGMLAERETPLRSEADSRGDMGVR